ncbi:AraC family transcriptional regulator [Chitinophaga nivalis]|uniref:Helix-turn-helix domain-containing protein n=1 Tax=Chitinophaga nivalis TaxID=2991709 RepID=A0ABT3INY8_9BACT|nr:helix-turn-helix domain-containing protein [Chitinophaga nivalis]MCW3464623.1 helix-turn-helix domain-containing protein [Chitinophaga nivalis]MCW3485686.1 helix-turn-helix domain-containing protein [Chitinophaga nivalis]
MQAIELIDQQHFSREYQFMAPSPDLAEHVLFYWLLDLRSPQRQDCTFEEILLANMYSSLVLNLGAPFAIHDQTDTWVHTCHTSELIGYHAAPVTYRHGFNNFLVGIKFKPASLNYLFQIKGADINRQTLNARDVLPRIDRLESAIYESRNLEAIKTLLETFLREQAPLPGAARHFRYVRQSLNSPALLESGYQLKKLAGLLYLSPRTLERYFADSLDISPKKCLSILRFRQALEHYARFGHKADWEELGYYDFSHFRKEWRRFTG